MTAPHLSDLAPLILYGEEVVTHRSVTVLVGSFEI